MSIFIRRPVGHIWLYSFQTIVGRLPYLEFPFLRLGDGILEFLFKSRHLAERKGPGNLQTPAKRPVTSKSQLYVERLWALKYVFQFVFQFVDGWSGLRRFWDIGVSKFRTSIIVLTETSIVLVSSTTRRNTLKRQGHTPGIEI